MIARVGREAADALAAIHAEAFARGWSAVEFAALLQNPAMIAVADDDGRGFALASSAGGEAEILTLAVRPAARRAGLGARLVAAAGAIAHQNGAASMHLEVAEDNAPARALYRKLGFAPAASRRGYYAEGKVHAIVMSRALPL
jgi:[ribosomal protein S18]-alanine N-acetyltransferase